MARGIDKLHLEVQEYAVRLVEECKKQGLEIKITDTLRSKAEQDALYAQGRTTSGSKVTNATYPKSNHNWGIAFDFCRNDGKGAFYDNDGFFTKVGKVGKSIGLSWGGDWTSFEDKPHFEYTGFGTWRALQSKYGTPAKFLSTAAPSTNTSSTSTSEGDKLIKEYQQALNNSHGKKLVVDGIYGPKTEVAAVTVKRKSKGELVTVLQKLLSSRTNYFDGAWDGVFGKVTEATVKTYQKYNGLTVDGIVGKKTWRHLLTWGK